jgi:hypothetical protein
MGDKRGMRGAFLAFLIHKEACYTYLTHPSFYNKKISFKEKIVSDVLKINFFKEKWETKGDEGCISNISHPFRGMIHML